MAGCRSFVVALDPTDPDAVWITEVWDSRSAWQASLELPGVKASIERSMPLVRTGARPARRSPSAGQGL